MCFSLERGCIFPIGKLVFLPWEKLYFFLETLYYLSFGRACIFPLREAVFFPWESLYYPLQELVFFPLERPYFSLGRACIFPLRGCIFPLGELVVFAWWWKYLQIYAIFPLFFCRSCAWFQNLPCLLFLHFYLPFSVSLYLCLCLSLSIIIFISLSHSLSIWMNRFKIQRTRQSLHERFLDIFFQLMFPVFLAQEWHPGFKLYAWILF